LPVVSTEDVYKVVLKGTLLTQEISNTFYYGRTTSSFHASDLVPAFINDMMPKIRAVTSSAVTYLSVAAQSIDDDTDGVLQAISLAGFRPSPVESSFEAWGYRLYHDILAARSGSKRFAGVADGDAGDGVPSGGVMLLIGALTAQLVAPLVIGGLPRFYPALKRLQYVGALPVPTFRQMSSAQFRWLTTQNSRKVGRGS